MTDVLAPVSAFVSRLSSQSRRWILGISLLSALFILYPTYTTYYADPLERSPGQVHEGIIRIVQQIHVTDHLPLVDAPGYAHEVGRRRLYLASSASHEQYASTWGYQYSLYDKDYAKEHGGHLTMGKLWALQDALMDEMAKPQRHRNRWIFVTDGDTLILDPSIPLHAFLPPGERMSLDDTFPPPHPRPSPLIVANQDGNGFNAGVMFIRIHPRIMTFINHTLSLESELRQAAGKDPSDQYLLGYALRQRANADVAAAFYEVPMMWFNEYWLDRDEGSQREHGDEGAAWTPQLQIHLCNNRWEWSTPHWDVDVVGRAGTIYQAGWQAGGGKGDLPVASGRVAEDEQSATIRTIREGFIKLGVGRRSALTANRWWRTIRGGIVGVKFTDV